MTTVRITAGINKAEDSGYHLSEVLCTSMADFRSKSAIDVQPLYPSTLTLWTEALEAHRNFPEQHLHRHHPSFPQLNRIAFVFSL